MPKSIPVSAVVPSSVLHSRRKETATSLESEDGQILSVGVIHIKSSRASIVNGSAED